MAQRLERIQDRLQHRHAVNAMLAAATAALLLGLWLPILTLSKLVVVENTFSLLSGIWQLFLAGQPLVGAILLAFSVLLPIAKLAIIAGYNNAGTRAREEAGLPAWLAFTGKWSMLDVFVVAVLVSTVKLGALASVSVRPGLYCFAAAVLLTALALHLVERRARQAERRAASGPVRSRHIVR